MYIKKIEIDSFGCLSNKTIEFENGFNIIFGSNESGKSTIFSFIIFMFYGTKIKKLSGELSFKERYMPWNGAAMQGRIYFNSSDKDYSLERTCTASRNSVKLYCITTGEEIKERSILNEVGEYFLNVSANSLYTSSYIAGESDKLIETGELINKLTASVESDSSDVSYKEMTDIINEEILNISSSKRKNAIIPNLQSKISFKNQIIVRFEENSNEVRNLRDKNNALNAQISRIEEVISSLLAENDDIESGTVQTSKEKSGYLLPLIISVLLLALLFFWFNPMSVSVFVISLIILALSFTKHIRKRYAAKDELSTKLFTMKKNNDKIISLKENINCIKTDIARNEERIAYLSIENTDVDGIKNEVDALMKELSDANRRLKALELSKLALSNAYREFKAIFSPKLSGLSAEILSRITNGKYEDMLVNDNLQMSISGNFGYKDSNAYSRGANQQAYLAMRLALSRIILSGDSDVPLLLDDTLAYFDSERLYSTLEFLLDESSEKQVIFATCRKQELDILRDKNINIIYL